MREVNLSEIKQAHFFGVGGIGLSAIARMFIAEGKRVSGSDVAGSALIDDLRKLGVAFTAGQDVSDIPTGTDLVVYSTAIEVADPAFHKKLRTSAIPAISYAEALSLVSKDKFTIAVSGTHGKTTTTAMTAKILMDAGMDPTVIIGSLLKETNSNFVAGKSRYLVVEVDEYQRKFLEVTPRILVITNIDEDHLDYFRDIGDIQEAFAALVARVPEDGAIVTNLSLQNVTPVLSAARASVLDYGSLLLKDLRLKFPGEHNRQNARAALTVAAFLGVPQEQALHSLSEFSGTWRRFEYLGKTKNGALVYDDYAHNPQKIRALLQGARELFPKKRIIAVFQPHLYSRTKTLLKELAGSFAAADQIVLVPIFPAREAPDQTISSEILAAKIKENYPGKSVQYVTPLNILADFLNLVSKKGDIIITIGAGDIYKVALTIST
ncbi:UDP-N-acetylmuramate--L-alanine ligase [Patescibacteria group bacterium]|nr:UDP-N-acetylmuramate--L-alanine ligase [Patescibacteria group bacterium]